MVIFSGLDAKYFLHTDHKKMTATFINNALRVHFVLTKEIDLGVQICYILIFRVMICVSHVNTCNRMQLSLVMTYLKL